MADSDENKHSWMDQGIESAPSIISVLKIP